MKRRATVLLVLQSAIAEAGIRSIASSVDTWDVAVESVTVADLLPSVSRLRPSLLIADPLLLTASDVSQARELSGGRMKLAVLYHSALPPAVTSLYDDALSIYAPPSALATMIADAASRSRGLDIDQTGDSDRRELSPREKDVVVGVVKGMSNKEIAAAMGVSVNTVTTHRRNIASKLKIHSPAGLTIYAIVSKLVAIDDAAL